MERLCIGAPFIMENAGGQPDRFSLTPLAREAPSIFLHCAMKPHFLVGLLLLVAPAGLSAKDRIDERARPAVTKERSNLYVLSTGGIGTKAAEIGPLFEHRSKPLFRHVEVKMVIGDQKTKQGILDGFTWLRERMTEKDVGVIFITAHGGSGPSGGLSLQTVDRHGGLKAKEIIPALKGIKGRLVFFISSCHAAGFLQVQGAKNLDNVVVMAACPADIGEARFGTHLVEALKGKADLNHDGIITLDELERHMAKQRSGKGNNNFPVIAHPASVNSFPLITTATPGRRH